MQKAASSSPAPCRHFLRGRCLYGDRCAFSHATPPPSQAAPAAKPAHTDEERSEVEELQQTLRSHVNGLRRSGAPRSE
eukprot:7339202-Prymnesium_polylepis.1